jgi:dienelactone hydrolase
VFVCQLAFRLELKPVQVPLLSTIPQTGRLNALLFAMAMIGLACPLHQAAAQRPTGAAAAATIAADLSFPNEPTAPEELSQKMALLIPKGEGPFPAAVLMHQCAGLNTTIIRHARELVAEGFVVLMIDSFGPRGVTSVCYGPRNGVNLFRGVRDALQALDHLRGLPMVQKAAISLVGYSWGGMIGLMAASPMFRAWLGFQTIPAAVVAHYPGCFTINPPSGRTFEVFSRDVDIPLLALLASDDTETPAEECQRKIQDANYPEMITTHVYPNATHCWDCKQIDGLQKIDIRGNSVSYRYDPAVTTDAMARTVAFLRRRY